MVAMYVGTSMRADVVAIVIVISEAVIVIGVPRGVFSITIAITAYPDISWSTSRMYDTLRASPRI